MYLPSSVDSDFRDAIKDSGLVNLGLVGYQFTWERSRGSVNWVEEKLD